MVIAALICFAAVLIAWIVAPDDSTAERPTPLHALAHEPAAT